MTQETGALFIGTAGWGIPRSIAERFPGEGQHLERYARVFSCAEINTSFYRSHKRQTYTRWAGHTPAGFRFSVKLPRTITHDARLHSPEVLLKKFLDEASGLGERLQVLLVQLPPSLSFEARVARTFFETLSSMHGASVVCEPRHASWFQPVADQLLAEWKIGRVAADPARHSSAGVPGGWMGPAGDGVGATLYYRWHGSPRIYYSAYTDTWLHTRAIELDSWPKESECWCIFDNTALGAAASNALSFTNQIFGHWHAQRAVFDEGN
ncbi:MAG: DUF72 domain-containing protein [Ottowia sp.]|uniref:DUF72 domain-containing protein n=1 Tax=Ottowia sp. TaxID=1898956 RepID=UPI003C72154A